MPAWINYYGRSDVILGLPWAFLVALAVTAVLVIVQRKTILGKYAAAIGGNRVAAELSGINVVKYVWVLYIIMGFFAALAGIARASYMSLGDPLSGDGMELNCIIAVLLGGTAFSGGEGSVAKSMIGAMIIVCVTVGLMTVIPPYWQNVAKGVVLLFAVILNLAGAGKHRDRSSMVNEARNKIRRERCQRSECAAIAGCPLDERGRRSRNGGGSGRPWRPEDGAPCDLVETCMLPGSSAARRVLSAQHREVAHRSSVTPMRSATTSSWIVFPIPWEVSRGYGIPIEATAPDQLRRERSGVFFRFGVIGGWRGQATPTRIARSR
jgi:hypothetical protein